MKNCVEQTIETRQDWVAPVLKKIDVEELTAAHVAGDDDGTTFS
jgi:hypothetical protein